MPNPRKLSNCKMIEMANVTKGWHTVYNSEVCVENGRIQKVYVKNGQYESTRGAIYMRDDPKIGGYTRLSEREWKGMKFTTFRSGMSKGIYIVERY